MYEEQIREAVLAIARKTHLAAQDGGKDFLYELARTAIAPIVGPGAVHSIDEWKTQEKLDWAIDQISKALE